ncbi:hypothetical protein H072_5055 [Dactylellina haptotyla CBS 200.50]|uniref:Uncharacterized protein n=1 Tax=Dactylellina haptotyla (strain CBS 200.50) TaxID=1284197 RepID=S8AIU0_DACHA|nr:hypothetical protein H072_5055 [Dactylellina haptotyla CBS 200.50]
MAPTNASVLSPSKEKPYESFAKKTKSVEVLVTVLLSSKKADAFGLDSAQVDWNLVAHRLSLKSAKVASTRFGQVKKELLDCAAAMNMLSKQHKPSDESEGELTPPETPVKAARAPATPRRSPKVTKANTPRRRGRPPKNQKLKQVEEEEAEEEEVQIAEPEEETPSEGEQSTDADVSA